MTADDLIGPSVLKTQRSFSVEGIRAGDTPESPPSPRKIGQLPAVGLSVSPGAAAAVKTRQRMKTSRVAAACRASDRLIPAFLSFPQYPTPGHPLGQAATQAAAVAGSARPMSSPNGTRTRTAGPRPEKERPGRSPAASAMRTQIPHLMHLPGSRLSPELAATSSM